MTVIYSIYLRGAIPFFLWQWCVTIAVLAISAILRARNRSVFRHPTQDSTPPEDR